MLDGDKIILHPPAALRDGVSSSDVILDFPGTARGAGGFGAMMTETRGVGLRFATLAEYFNRLEQTSSRRQLVLSLAELLAMASTDEIKPVVYLCQGRVAPFFEPI